MKKITLLILSVFCCCTTVLAQDPACTAENQAALDTCIADATAVCKATYPQCVPAVLTLDDVRAAIAEKCNCDTAKNYGKYRSCVSHVLTGVRALGELSQAIKDGINADNSVCKAAINERKENNKGGNKGGNGNGNKDKDK